jgi:hypothetical protein
MAANTLTTTAGRTGSIPLPKRVLAPVPKKLSQFDPELAVCHEANTRMEERWITQSQSVLDQRFSAIEKRIIELEKRVIKLEG